MSSKILEQYKIKSYSDKEIVIRLYKDGSHACSCQKFSKSVFCKCWHIEDLKSGRAEVIEAIRKG